MNCGKAIKIQTHCQWYSSLLTDEDSKPVWLFGQYVASSIRLETLAFVETEEEANALMLQYAEQFADGGCRFYVPTSLVEAYKSATNWSACAEQIRAIEDYPEITGGATILGIEY